MITSNRFRGWGQYTSEEFSTLSNAEKYGKLFFVRDLDSSGSTVGAKIYFGTRLYAELNDSGATGEIINNIITALGSMVNEKGEFIGFSIDHEILNNAADATEALTLLESAIISAETSLEIIESDYLTSIDKAELEELIAEEVSARTADDVQDVEYNSLTQRIFIRFNDGTTTRGFDASRFVIDGMLSSVTYDVSAHTMTFIWNTDAGSQEITVNLDDIISPYRGDEQSIHLGKNNTFSAIKDQPGGVASHEVLESEISARTEADETLAEAIEEESESRAADDQALQEAIEQEVSARTEADEALAEAIENVEDDVEELEFQLSSLTEEIIKDEKVVAKALTYLDDKTDGIEQVKENLSALTQDVIDNEEVIAEALNQLRQDMIDNEEVTAEALNQLNQNMIDNEEVTAEALNQLRQDMIDNEEVTAEALNQLRQDMIDNEEVTAEALNELNAKIGSGGLEATGELYPVLDVVSELPQETSIGDRYLVGHDAIYSGDTKTEDADYSVVEITSDPSKPVIIPLDNYCVRVLSRNNWTYQLIGDQLMSYDQFIDCGTY